MQRSERSVSVNPTGPIRGSHVVIATTNHDSIAIIVIATAAVVARIVVVIAVGIREPLLIRAATFALDHAPRDIACPGTDGCSTQRTAVGVRADRRARGSAEQRGLTRRVTRAEAEGHQETDRSNWNQFLERRLHVRRIGLNPPGARDVSGYPSCTMGLSLASSRRSSVDPADMPL